MSPGGARTAGQPPLSPGWMCPSPPSPSSSRSQAGGHSRGSISKASCEPRQPKSTNKSSGGVTAIPTTRSYQPLTKDKSESPSPQFLPSAPPWSRRVSITAGIKAFLSIVSWRPGQPVALGHSSGMKGARSPQGKGTRGSSCCACPAGLRQSPSGRAGTEPGWLCPLPALHCWGSAWGCHSLGLAQLGAGTAAPLQAQEHPQPSTPT